MAGELTGKFTSTIKENLTSNSPTYVPRQTVYQWLKKWKVPVIDYPSIEMEGTTLYVMADEKYIYEQIKNNDTKIDENTKKRKNVMILCQNVL